MKRISIALLFALTACGGNLSDEQRKKFKEGMEQEKLVRITEPEILTASIAKGQRVMNSLERKPFSAALLDSVEKVHQVKIHWTVPGAQNALAIEQELIEAYITGITTGTAAENLQKIYNSAQKKSYDTLLYSKPSVTVLPDGSEQLDGIWNIYIPKKQITVEISKSK